MESAMAKPGKTESPPNPRRLCLAFSNTVAWHAGPQPQETLHTYAELVRWAQNALVLSAPGARRLLRLAAKHPREAEQVLKRAIALREAIYRILVASLRGQSPAPADLGGLNQTIRKLTRGAQIAKTPKGYSWIWNGEENTLDSLLGPIALSASELLTSADLERLGQCADDRGCGWLFLDTSKNRSRRWCDVKDCGNRARQRRFHARARKPG